MSEKLKPCPFCGNEAEYHECIGKHLKIYSVRCKCGASRTGISKEDVIVLWNRRANDGKID